MKPLLAPLAVVLLSIGTTACSSSNKSTNSAPRTSSSGTTATASSTTPTQSYTKADADKDNDVEAPDDDTNNNSVLDFGHAANAADRQAITTLVKRYYAAALAGDGAQACSMIYSTFAEAIPEDYGQSPPGPSYLKGGTTCPAVMVLLFKHFHSQLAVQVPLLEVSRVRLKEHQGLAVLRFGKMPERQIDVGREGQHAWKVEALLDSELP
jgi:hypothetical protein